MSLHDLYIEGIQTLLGPNFKLETKKNIAKVVLTFLCLDENPAL